MVDADVPGLVVTVVQGGEVVLARGFGEARRRPSTPVDPVRTTFRVGSLSKSLTASALLALVKRGELSLDTDVASLLATAPPPRGVPPQTWDEMRRRVPPALAPGVTPLHLLGHTAGLDERLFGQHVVPPRSGLSLAGWFARYPPHHFDAPGRVIAYNDQGTALAGLVLEAVTGERFEAWTAQHLFAPLGLERTTFLQADAPAVVMADRAFAYGRPGGAGTPLRPYPVDAVITTPAAGLWTTGADMGRYLLALLRPEEHGAGALTPAVARHQLATAVTQHATFSGRAHGFAESTRGEWRLLHKDGQASGFSARLTLVPEADIGIFSASNRSILDVGWEFNRAARIHRDLASTVLAELLPETPAASDPPGNETLTAEPLPPPPFAVAQDTSHPPPLLPGTYRDVVAARGTVEKLLSASSQIRVTDAGEGRVAVFGVVWEPAAPGLYAPVEGGSTHLGAGADGAGEPRYLFLGGGAFERIPWIDTRQALEWGLGGGALVGLLLLGIGPWVARNASPFLRRAALASTAAGAALLAFEGILAWAALRIDPQAWFHGVPLSVRLALLLPPTSLLAAVAGSAFLTVAWRHEANRRGVRLALAASLAALVASLVVLARWNLFAGLG